MNDRTGGTDTSHGRHARNLPSLRRRIRHLVDLARRDRPAAEEAFAQLGAAAREELVLAAPPAARMDVLLLSEDCTELVQALPEGEFYRTVHAVGMWDAQEIIETASREQIAFLLDHDCWKGERFRPRKFLNWLRLFLECGDAEAERILGLLSPDLLVFALKRYVRFAGDIIVAGRYHCTPDQIRVANPTVHEFVLRLYDIDSEYFVRLMAWVSTLGGSTAQADALAAREGRLVEQGFPHMSQSQAVYEVVDPEQLPGLLDDPVPADLAASHSVLVAERGRTLFFLRALERGIRAGRFPPTFTARFQHEIVLLANKVMVADQVDLADEKTQRRVLDRARRWVNVGIEALSGRDEERGVEIIAAHELEFSFRVTHTLMTRLATEIADIETRLPERLLRPLLGGRYAAAWDALHNEEPALPPPRTGGPGSRRPIGTLAEYRAALGLAREIGAIVGLHTGGLPIDVQRVLREGGDGGRPAPSADEISGMIIAQVLESGGRPSGFEVLPARTWRTRLGRSIPVAGGPGTAHGLLEEWIGRWHDGHSPFEMEVLRRFWSEVVVLDGS